MRRLNGTGAITAAGYVSIYKGGEFRYEHIRVVEAVLGKRLPKGAVVHHVDGNKLNNAPSNLVVCPDQKYHGLLQVAFVHHEGAYNAEELQVQRALAVRMMGSVERHMSCRLIHLTDMDTPAISRNVIRISPRGKHFIPWYLELYAALPEKTLILDTDTVVQEDVSAVWKENFDVAVVGKTRGVPEYKDQPMPFNLGVCFSNGPDFWLELKKRVEKHTDELMLGWWGAQVEIWKMYQEREWRIHVLPERYNYTPKERNEDVSDKAIVHFKGNHRKTWGLEGFKEQPEEREVPLYAQ